MIIPVTVSESGWSRNYSRSYVALAQRNGYPGQASTPDDEKSTRSAAQLSMSGGPCVDTHYCHLGQPTLLAAAPPGAP